MNTAAWTGLLLGVPIGLICGVWQAWDMRRGTNAMPGLGRLASATGRLVFLLAALVVAVEWAGADKLWLVGSVAVVYTGMFLWKFRRALTKKQ